jgi:hypothetical protein
MVPVFSICLPIGADWDRSGNTGLTCSHSGCWCLWGLGLLMCPGMSNFIVLNSCPCMCHFCRLAACNYLWVRSCRLCFRSTEHVFELGVLRCDTAVSSIRHADAGGLSNRLLWLTMDDIVDLGDSPHCPSTQVPIGADCDYEDGFLDNQFPPPSAADSRRGGAHSRGRTVAASSLSGPSQSQNAVPHKLRGPNWTEQEMLVLIGQKRIEWDGRHNCSQPSLAKFVYGTTTWKQVLAGCMSMVGFRAKDADQLTNKWDGLIKDYKN